MAEPFPLAPSLWTATAPPAPPAPPLEASARADVCVIGAGYALIVSLAWHTREAAVLGIEDRDGVKFYVVPNSALQPVELVRTPGLRSDRLHAH